MPGDTGWFILNGSANCQAPSKVSITERYTFFILSGAGMGTSWPPIHSNARWHITNFVWEMQISAEVTLAINLHSTRSGTRILRNPKKRFGFSQNRNRKAYAWLTEWLTDRRTDRPAWLTCVTQLPIWTRPTINNLPIWTFDWPTMTPRAKKESEDKRSDWIGIFNWIVA